MPSALPICATNQTRYWLELDLDMASIKRYEIPRICYKPVWHSSLSTGLATQSICVWASSEAVKLKSINWRHCAVSCACYKDNKQVLHSPLTMQCLQLMLCHKGKWCTINTEIICFIMCGYLIFHFAWWWIVNVVVFHFLHRGSESFRSPNKIPILACQQKLT